MKIFHTLTTFCVLLYTPQVFATSTDAWGISPANPASSLYNAPNRASGAGNNDPALPFGARVIPLEAFNYALSRGLFKPSSSQTLERFAYGNAGALNDPSTMGLRTVIEKAPAPTLAQGGMEIPVGETSFIVVSDARYSPYSDDEIEAQSYFVVSGYLNTLDENNYYIQAKTPWISVTNPPFLFVDNKGSQTPITFPTTCCNTDTFSDGLLSGYRCIHPSTSRTLFASEEALYLPMGRAQHVPLYVLKNPNTYPLANYNNNTFRFTQINTPPLNFQTPALCLSCTRSVGNAPFGCNQPVGCHTPQDCTSSEHCNTQNHRCETLRAVQCNADEDCGFNERCLSNRCVAAAAHNPPLKNCFTDNDCSAKELCNPLSHTCQLRQAAPTPNKPPHQAVVDQHSSHGVDINENLQHPESLVDEMNNANNDSLDLSDIDFTEGLGDYDFGWMQNNQATGTCPRDNEITVLHCLDNDFMDSPCGQKYQPAAGPPNYAVSGEQPNLCTQLILNAVRTQPKRNPRMQEPEMETVCEEEYVPHVNNANDLPNNGPPQAYERGFNKPQNTRSLPIQQAAQNNGAYDLSLDPEVAENGIGSLAEDLNEQDDYITECREQAVEGTDPAAVTYQQLWSQYNTLYQLDGRPLQERLPAHTPFQWDADTDYNRRGLQYNGGTDTQSAQDRRTQVTYQQNNAATRNAIQSRERRFAGNGVQQKINNCSEYVFQRFYDHSRFLEEAALLGSDDWAIWQLAFGDVLLPTSIGSRMLNPHWDGVKTFLGDGITDRHGNALRALLPGQWDAYRGVYDGQPNDRDARYYKNVFFSTLLPETLALNDFSFPYFNLMRVAQTPEGNMGGIRHNDLKTVRDWNYHQRIGQFLKDKGYTLKDFDNFSNREMPEFIAARNRLLRAVVNSISPYPNSDRAPSCKDGSCCTSCACKIEKWILPWHATNRTHADRFFEWMDHGYLWGYVADRRAQAQRNGRNGDFCTQRITQEIRDAAQAVSILLTRAELKGYLDLNTPTVADWSPRWFSETTKALFSHEKEEMYKWCKLWTNDDFNVYKQRFAHINNSEGGNLDAILRNYHTLDDSFSTYQRRLNQLPESVRRGTDWHRGDTVEAGDAGFGVSYSYHSDIDVDDYTNDRNVPSPMDVTISADASFDVGVEVFGVQMPLLSAGIDFDSEEGAHLPVVRILDFDMLSPARDLAGDALDAVSDLSNLVESPIDLPEGGVGDFTFARQEYNVDIVSFQFSYIIPVGGPLSVIVTGGMSGSAGVRTSASYNTESTVPVHLNGEVAPYVNSKVFLEGAVSAVVASVAVRTTIIIIDFSLPLTADMRIAANPIDPTDLNLDFDVVGKGSLEMLSGNIRLRICAGIWPFEYCYRKKIFEWDAAMHYDFTLFDLGLDEPVSLYDLALAEILR